MDKTLARTSLMNNVLLDKARRHHDSGQLSLAENIYRKILDKRSLIAGVHSFLSHENPKYKIILPPLCPLPASEDKKMMDELKNLNFYPEKKAA